MFENRRMPNGTSEPSLGLCGVGGRACEGSLYPINFLKNTLKPEAICYSLFSLLLSRDNSNVLGSAFDAGRARSQKYVSRRPEKRRDR